MVLINIKVGTTFYIQIAAGLILQTSNECSRQALSSKNKGYIVSMDWLRVVIKRGYNIAQGAVRLRSATYKSRMTENGGRTVPTVLHRVATFHQLARNARIRPCEQVTPRACDPSSRASPFKI